MSDTGFYKSSHTFFVTQAWTPALSLNMNINLNTDFKAYILYGCDTTETKWSLS